MRAREFYLISAQNNFNGKSSLPVATNIVTDGRGDLLELSPIYTPGRAPGQFIIVFIPRVAVGVAALARAQSDSHVHFPGLFCLSLIAPAVARSSVVSNTRLGRVCAEQRLHGHVRAEVVDGVSVHPYGAHITQSLGNLHL